MNGKPRTIAFVQTQAESAGAQEISRQLAHGVKAKGWEARQIFLFRRTDSFDLEENTFFCANERPSSIYGVAKLMLRLFSDLRREAPDAIITFQHFGNVIAAPIARLAGVKLIVANQVSAPKTVTTAVRLVDKMIGSMGAYDRIVVNSAVTASDYRDYPPAYSRRVVRIDHGFQDKTALLEKTAARRELRLPEGVELLGCAARLHPLKQLDLAIRVLNVNKTQHLALAGQGPDRARLETLAREIGVADRLHFCGELDSRKMGAFLAAIDCFVFPSAAETFGLAPVEAAQAGVPVVANDIEALKDTLAFDGEPCALFVDAGDINAFATAIRRVFDDEALNESLSSRGHHLAERFPLDRMVDAYLQLIDMKSK